MEYFKQSLKLTFICILIFSVGYPILLWSIGRLFPENAEGKPIYKDGTVIGFENIGQKFVMNKYFISRPSAVNYNASSSGVSNYGYTNPELIKLLKERIDTFLSKNPDVSRNRIPPDLITSSGSGLDPHISYEAAIVQISRISKARNIESSLVKEIVEKFSEKPFIGIFSKPKVNVLKLNIALDNLPNNSPK